MPRYPQERSQRLSTLAATMYAHADMTLATMEMTGIRLCSANSDVMYADRFQVILLWKALVAYSSQKLNVSSAKEGVTHKT